MKTIQGNNVSLDVFAVSCEITITVNYCANEVAIVDQLYIPVIQN